ncbi:hypothetical protein [Dyadobacter sp.]|uniref:hypothetical protein n=1 Tax=Dyadobacter sp. TaxID=1914288 RepID=UPI003F6EA993
MSKKKNKYGEVEIGDLEAIVGSADAFYKIGYRIALRYARAKRENKLSQFNNYELAVGATDILLSFELYLKALILILTGLYVEGHHLLALFDKLPENVRNELSANFWAGKTNLRGDFPIIRRLSPVLGQQYDPWKNEINLRSFFEVHNEGFVEWRYQF